MIKTCVCVEPGLLQYEQRPLPVPSTGRAILQIKRAGICGTDLHAFEGTQPYFSYPRILGHELAADLIEADGAPGFKPGERVGLMPYFSCGYCIACRSGKPNCCVRIQVLGVHIDGGFAQYISVPSASLVKARELDYDQLAMVEPLAIGAHAVGRADVRPEEFVLVVGAGPIGLGIMDFARLAGARVIAVDSNPTRLQFCRSHRKAEFILAPRAGDIAEQLAEITQGDMPVVVFDATGNRGAINQGFGYMAHGGRYILVGLQKGDIQVSHPEFHQRESALMSSRNATRADFDQVILAIVMGQVDPLEYLTHRLRIAQLDREFAQLLDPSAGVIKALVEFDDWL
jgi:2-desacetyl-2-hydroxyethyl bacteriochlorophyllide A dehydrogenase